MNISGILDQIDEGAIVLPVFQRGYVWNREQVRSLMDSLYRGHPIGSILTWVTGAEGVVHRGDGPIQAGHVRLLLDGQQRLTSLYGIIRGKHPPFFEGNPATFTGLHFNFETQVFEFYAPIRMGQDPRWVDVTELMQQGIGNVIQAIAASPELTGKMEDYLNRLIHVTNIGNVELHAEDITGADKTVDVVVDIFNRVNSAGTSLSKGDLALAKVCASWPEARTELRHRLAKWRNAGFNFKLEWLLRCVNSLVTGQALFAPLGRVSPEDFQEGLSRTEKHIDRLLNLISSRLGLDHDRVLGSRYSFPLMVKYLDDRGGNLVDLKERDGLLFWYIHTLLWGRYSGSTESVLNQDLQAIEDVDEGMANLLEGLRRNRGDLKVAAADFSGWSVGNRFYSLLYMLTRIQHARDWDTGVELSGHTLGKSTSLQLHHIFPKSRLYKRGYERREVNALANFTFLTQETNLKVSNRHPAEYIPEFEARNPGVFKSHWIPMEPRLWEYENYREFLEARRELLANAANELLDSLLGGTVPEATPTDSPLVAPAGGVGAAEDDDEEKILLDTNIWVIEQGLPEGEMNYELLADYPEDPSVVEVIAELDLAWPNGLQEGYSQPVALLIDEGQDVRKAASQAGFRYYTDFESFKAYVEDEVLASKQEYPVAV